MITPALLLFFVCRLSFAQPAGGETSATAPTPPLGDVDAGSIPGEAQTRENPSAAQADAGTNASDGKFPVSSTAAPSDPTDMPRDPSLAGIQGMQQAPVAHNSETVQVSTTPPAAGFNPYRYFGLGADVGISGPLPDAGLMLTFKPVKFAHFQLGGTTNFLGFGVRGGATVVNPFFVPLSVTCEAGHFFEADVNRARRWFGSDSDDMASLSKFSYDYMNVLGGMIFEFRHVAFFFRGGTTWMRATIRDFQQTVYQTTNVQVQASDPRLSYRGPSVRIGMLFFL